MTDIRKHYIDCGQGHVFTHFDSLSEAEQQTLLSQATAIDLGEISELVATLIHSPRTGS